MDNTANTDGKTRYCTIPKLPFKWREKLENKFGDLCKEHDNAYSKKLCKLCADYKFMNGFFKRGYYALGIVAFIIVQTPIAWYRFYTN